MSKGLIIFDFDGTLGDTRRNIVTTMQMTIANLQLPNRSEEENEETRYRTGIYYTNAEDLSVIEKVLVRDDEYLK